MKWLFCLICLFLISQHSVFAQPQEKIVVGTKNFTEQHILGRLLKIVLEQHDFAVEEKINILTKEIRTKLLNREIDIYWEYTGTAYSAHLRQNDPTIFSNPDKLFHKLQELDKSNGIVWLKRAPLNNAYGLAVTLETSKRLNLNRLSDLRRVMQTDLLVFGVGKAFFARPDGFYKMTSHYRLDIPSESVKLMASPVVYGALRRGQIKVGMSYATDAKIKKYDIVFLEDDRSFFPVYNPAPIVLERTLKRHPVLAKLADQIAPFLDQQTIIGLNYQVEIEKRSVDDVAREWLQQIGVLK